MINRRCRRCSCMNNCHQVNPENIENICNNVVSPAQEFNNNCSCGFDDDTIDVFPKNPALAQSYVPYQFMEDTFKPCTGLEHGTIFPELVSPYRPCDSMREIAYLEKTNSIGEGCNSCH